MPGVYRYPLSQLGAVCDILMKKQINACALFPAIQEDKKNDSDSEALNEKCLIPLAVQYIKTNFPDLVVITDIALDPFSSMGHDGLVKDGKVLNDATVSILSKMAVLHAQAGADMVAPSDMMDGRVGAIRSALDQHGCQDTCILSYAAKYASSLYGPFRDALNSAPKNGDKKTYQMDPSNRIEALKEAELDVLEGADMVMVKPATFYLDIISDLKDHVDVPIAAYHVSGEYAMLKAAHEKGMMDYQAGLYEALLSIKRAGADLIFSYGALDVVDQLT